MDIAENDIKDLRYAKTLLENPSLAARISNLLGTPIEKGCLLYTSPSPRD